MSNYLLQGKSFNTIKTYHGNFRKWKIFAEKQGFQCLPAQPVHIALYITHLLDTGSLSHVVNHVIYSIKWAHELHSFADPTNNSYIKCLQESSKRIATPTVSRKDPVSAEMLIRLCDLYVSSNDVMIVRDLAMILNKKLSYTAARENIISRLKEVSSGLNLGLHSLRAGGATAAVASNVNERCIKRHGRWKCESSKDMYIVDEFENRIAVSKKLGL
ncbi:uncharacterized protein LOC134229117 [Saccostrea cucullata]|uniref:uncharacterized protein LOC134229117 n=1 Tax=Saccostrea cuccullata TaxID=36930 RepID=UPI002ED21F96